MITLKNSRYSRRFGFTLTELAIVLGVVGTILGGIWGASAKVNASNKTQRASAQVAQIINNYRTLYAQHNVDEPLAGWQDVTCRGVNAKFFPPEMIQQTCVQGTTSTYPVGPWGGADFVRMYADRDNNTLLIEYNSLNQAACEALANNVYAASDIAYEAIDKDGTWAAQWLPPYDNTKTSLTASQVDAECGTNNVVQAGFPAR